VAFGKNRKLFVIVILKMNLNMNTLL